MSFAGLAEILIIAVLALIIVGPKDLPKVLFMLGRFIQRIRSLSGEFMKEFESIHHFAETEDMAKRQKENNAKTPS